jgi:hypothetical protein
MTAANGICLKDIEKLVTFRCLSIFSYKISAKRVTLKNKIRQVLFSQ